MSENTKQGNWGADQTQYFYQLDPIAVLEAVDKLGPQTTGVINQLNSMENRVYDCAIEPFEVESVVENNVIVKFYRPGRWSRDQIQEEHDFLAELNEAEIPAIAPLRFEGESLFEYKDLFYTLFPRRGGRMLDEITDEIIPQLGRLLARLHNTGSVQTGVHRLNLDGETFGDHNLNYLLTQNLIPPHMQKRFEQTVNGLIERAKGLLSDARYQRVHGDCHHGNLLMGRDGLFLVDFDDMVNAPVVQDFWMMLGNYHQNQGQWEDFIEAYSSMRDFDRRELALIDSLQFLRVLHYSSWVAHRRDDPAFIRAFPEFGTDAYWEGELRFYENLAQKETPKVWP